MSKILLCVCAKVKLVGTQLELRLIKIRLVYMVDPNAGTPASLEGPDFVF